MLQLIIWMFCVYFIVKGFEIVSDPTRRNGYGTIGAVLAFIAAPTFFLLSLQQVSQQPDFPSYGSTLDSLSGPEVDEATNEAGAAADRALAEAQRALDNATATLDGN